MGTEVGLSSGAASPRGPRRPRRFVALWEDSTRGELGWTDGLHTGVGHLDHEAWLAWLHAGRPLGRVAAWLVEYEVCLDSSASPEMGPSRRLVEMDSWSLLLEVPEQGRVVVPTTPSIAYLLGRRG